MVTIGAGTQIAGDRGDINLDATVDVRDALHVLKMAVSSSVIVGGTTIASPYTPALKYRADVNGNGLIQSNDATLILRKVLAINTNLYPMSSAGKATSEKPALQLFANRGTDCSELKFQLAASTINGVTSGDFTIRFNFEVLEFESLENTRMMDAVHLEYSLRDPGILKIAMAQANGITDIDAILFGINFRTKDSVHLSNDIISLDEGLLWNEESKAMPVSLRYTEIDLGNNRPMVIVLKQNSPNPFNPTTTIEFSVQRESGVVLKVYNVSGQEVATLVEEKLTPGIHSVVWDAKGMPSGTYFYTIKSVGYAETKKMLLLK